MPNNQKKTPIKNNKTIDSYKEAYFSHLEKLVRDDKSIALLFQAFKNGKNTYAGIHRRENKTYSPDFIVEIESAIGSLEAIVNDPHRFIKENPLVVEVEKAKRVTHHSIKHMAQHTENIASVGNDGSVDPKRVLNMFIEDELKIYENRFIMTLVRRLQTFIELRYKYIIEHSDTRDSDAVAMTSQVKIGDVTYEMETKLKVVIPSDDEGHRGANQDLLNRLIMLRKRTLFLATSRFMLEMQKAAPVSDPVLQTNIMRLNYDYQNAYRLWLFISRYDQLGIEYKFQETKFDFNEDYLNRLAFLNLSSYLSVDSPNQILPDDDSKLYFYKPKFQKLNLDVDLTDERIFAKGNPFKINNNRETEAQIAAKLKRQKAAEERRLKKAEEKQKQKELAAQKRLEAKKKAEEKRLEAKKKAEEKKAREAERKRQLALVAAERKRIEKIKLEEAKKLEKARQDVAKIAIKRKKVISNERTSSKSKK